MRSGLIDDLAVFLAVAETGSMAAAARRLTLDPSTVSRRIGRVEEELGIVLFQRTGSGMALSEPGRRLASRVRLGMDQLELGVDEATRPPDALEGVVRVTAPTEIGCAMVQPVLQQVQGEHPGIQFELDLGAQVRDLGQRQADIALRTVRPTHGDIVTRALGGPAMWPYRAAHLPDAQARMRWLAWIGGDPLVERHVAETPGARVVLRTNDLAGIRAACVAGMGTALMPEPLAGLHGLVSLEGFESIVGPPLWLAAPTAALERPRVRALWDAIIDLWAQLVA